MPADLVVTGCLFAAVVAAAGCALALGGAALPITPQGLADSDAYMKQRKFDVLMDANKPAEPAVFGRVKRVYVTGSGPRVIVLHEIPGLREGDVKLGSALGEFFEVYMPLMFGVAGQDDTGLGKRQSCKADLFRCSDRNTRHQITPDLQAMTDRICGSTPCGIVGMCLTGSFPLYLIQPTNEVVAMVIAQPTLPFIHFPPFTALDISEEDTAAAMKLAVDRKASIYMVRYRRDWISGHAAFNKLLDRIAPSKDKLAFFDSKEVEVSGHNHSTLVHNPDHPEVAKEQLQLVVKALNAGLRRPPARPRMN
jgi:hypothetical protein